MILVYHTSLRYYNYEKVDLNSYNNSSQKKVIWMVLDEFDPSIAFTNINQLINFEKLKENSILLENSYSPFKPYFGEFTINFYVKRYK